MEHLRQNLTLKILSATTVLTDILQPLDDGVTRLLGGDDNFAPGQHPDELASLALDGYGGVFCAPLQLMKYEDPQPEAYPFLQVLSRQFTRLFDIARRLATRYGIKPSFMRRFDIRSNLIFSLDFLSAAKRSSIRADSHRATIFRTRAIEAICAAVRGLWAWLRMMCRRLRQEGWNDSAPLEISPFVRRSVALVDREGEFIVLRNPNGPGALTIPVRRECVMVWRIIRRLVETCDETGVAELPRDYGGYFRLDQKGLNTGLPKLYRHIHPVKGRPDHYRLQWEEKPKLSR